MKSNLYFKHDLYALDDTKLRRLVLKHGAVGYATFFETVSKLMKEESHRCEKSFLVSDLSYALHEDESKIASALEYAVSCGLFTENSGFLESERVNRTCTEFSEYSHRQAENARKRWENKSNPTASKGNANAMPSHSKRNATAMPIKEIEIEKENKNYNLGSPLQEENLSINTKDKTDKTEIVCSEPSDGLKLEAENPPSSDPVFLTITTNRKEEFPIHESDVQFWEETYPGVDVRSELRKIKAWSRDNASQRKTAKGMKGFCNRWLSREQDRAGTRQDSNVKGAPVRMSLVADGTREGNKERRPVFK